VSLGLITVRQIFCGFDSRTELDMPMQTFVFSVSCFANYNGGIHHKCQSIQLPGRKLRRGNKWIQTILHFRIEEISGEILIASHRI